MITVPPTIDGRTWTLIPEVALGGGGGRSVVRTDVNGTRHVVRLTNNPGEPLTIAADGGDGCIDTADALALEALYESQTIFAVSFPGLNPDGSTLAHARCVLLDRPQFTHADGNLTRYRFTLTLI